ncbi:hypothetical protein B0O99DRAFT_713121 [Bisporella sp. PMI_857]|nr:hypothetical protein B0O99DRAFT_713121 [Bisporella sp. PMI_857]
MACEPIWYGENIARRGSHVYFCGWNQTILDPIVEPVRTIHTSEFAYIFGNLSHYDTNEYPFNLTRKGYVLTTRGSRSWSTLTSVGQPGVKGHHTFLGFTSTFPGDKGSYIFVIGGPHEGLPVIDGPDSFPEVSSQKLRERCGFIISPEIIERFRY